MHLPVATIRCLAAAAICTTALAKPRSVQVDAAFGDCQWAAEVTIESVGEMIRVRLSEDADAIYRGHARMGEVVDVRPCVGGPETCRHDLLTLAGTRVRVLMVVAQDGNIVLVGSPQMIDEAAGGSRARRGARSESSHRSA